MIRWTARSVMPTCNATSRSTTEGFRDKSTSTCEWFVKNVHCKPADSLVGAFGGMTAVERGFDFAESLRAAVRAGFRELILGFVGGVFMAAARLLAESINRRIDMYSSLTAERRYGNSELETANRHPRRLKLPYEKCRKIATSI